jgi:hypothetical protein
MSTATGTQKWMSVRMLANVLCRGAISLGMPLSLKGSAAMLGQIEQVIHYGIEDRQKRGTLGDLGCCGVAQARQRTGLP